MRMLGRNLGPSDPRDVILAELARRDHPPLSALEPPIFLGRHRDQAVTAILGDRYRLRQCAVGERARSA